MMATEEVSNQEDILDKLPKKEITDEENLTSTLSIQVIKGISPCNTFKIRGTLTCCNVLVLVDNGSSDLFLNEDLAKGIKNRVVRDKSLMVKVANGQ